MRFTLCRGPKISGGSIQGEFCEVFLNGKYIGLYCLSEKLDRKQAELDKENGRIVRSVEASKYGVNIMSFTQMGTKPPEGSTWYNMEIKYPKEEDVQTADWDEFYAFIDFVNKSSDEEFAAEIGKYIDIDNFASYYDTLEAQGAWTREKEKWPSFKEYYWFDAEKEYRFVQEYMKERWDFVDSYFNGDNLSAGKWLYQ